MMKRYAVLYSWAAIGLAALLVGAADLKNENAVKVERLLKQIEKHHGRGGHRNQKAVLTERQLNDYIGYRLAREKDTPISLLTVRLLEANHVQGKVVLDARQLNLDLFFGETLDFDFKGLLHSRNGTARLKLGTLLLHGRPVSPQAMDLVIGAIALYSGAQPSRADDWYSLPKGLDRIIVKRGKADLFY
ncbi:MAG: hypothetical protein P8X96_20725 [Desulfobacteraceae bacterium]